MNFELKGLISNKKIKKEEIYKRRGLLQNHTDTPMAGLPFYTSWSILKVNIT